MCSVEFFFCTATKVRVWFKQNMFAKAIRTLLQERGGGRILMSNDVSPRLGSLDMKFDSYLGTYCFATLMLGDILLCYTNAWRHIALLH